jgi:hypothetical protein
MSHTTMTSRMGPLANIVAGPEARNVRFRTIRLSNPGEWAYSGTKSDPRSASRHHAMEGGLDHIDLLELLDYTHAQLSKIRQAVAASGHAGTMFSIDCLVGAAAEQTKCKLASLKHAGMPIGQDGPVGLHRATDAVEGRIRRPGRLASSGKSAARSSTRTKRLP